ncbi:MAG: hypothetical protein Q8L20_10995 [Gammaproteobacteria bacterium]|nr:hypothetical protein [Gammaproteobacteria bacterium]
MPVTVDISDDGFLNLLRCQNGGALIEELDRELIKGVGAVLDHGGASKITLQISLKRIRDLDSAMTIHHDVKVSHPKEPRPAKAMFVTQGNGLADQKADQMRLSLSESATQRASVLSAETSSGKVSRLPSAGDRTA